MWNRYRNVNTNPDVLCAWNTVVFHVLSPRVVAVAVEALSLGRTDTTFIVPVDPVPCVETPSFVSGETESLLFVFFALSLSRIAMSPVAVSSVVDAFFVFDPISCVWVGRMDAMAASAPVANPRSISVRRVSSSLRFPSAPSSSLFPRIPCTRRVRPEKTVPSASARSGVRVKERIRMTTRANPTRLPMMMTTRVVCPIPGAGGGGGRAGGGRGGLGAM